MHTAAHLDADDSVGARTNWFYDIHLPANV